MAEPTKQEGAWNSSTGTDGKPAVLIIGGLGYIGRFLALHLHQNNLASEVRLVDKVLPQLARLAPEFSEACSQDKFMQADASRERESLIMPNRLLIPVYINVDADGYQCGCLESLSRIFTPVTASEYTYVFNCGGETRYSQDDSVYSARSLALSLNLGRECARRKTPALVEFSTGMVYKPPSSSAVSSGGCTETANLKPWLKIAKYKLQVEEGLEKLAKEQGLQYASLRLAHVYGPYDVGFIARGLCLARVYKSQGKEMKWLWSKDLRVNTVHVSDVCRAAWSAASWCAANPPATTSSALLSERAFNIVDEGDTSQGTLATIFGSIFGIQTGFQGTLISSFARFNLDSVVDDVNEEILQPWADLLKENGIAESGPLTPFMEKELLKDCDLSLNAAKAERVLGWTRSKPKLGEEEVKEVLGSYGKMNWWP